MKKFISLFIKNSENVDDEKVRKQYGNLSGIMGIILNVFMSALKITVGAITGAISVLSDGVNNLSDAGSSVITLLGFKLSNKKPDKHHPYGHGRLEYFAGLIVSMIIIFIGVELFTSSINKISSGEILSFNSDLVFIVTVGVLFISILIKLWMFLFNRYSGKKIKSALLIATSMDSITDCVSTFVVLICTIISKFYTGFSIDGVAGILVSLFICYTGLKSVKDIVDVFIGSAPDPELVNKIADYVLNFDKRVVGIHDFMLHDYGPGRKIIILHVEVPSDGDILELHDMIDNIEKGLETEFNAMATIHLDPVITNNERVKELKELCIKIIKELDENFTLHDFRMNEGETHANLIFDVVITHETKLSNEYIKEEINKKVKEYDSKLACVINVEYSYV